MNRPKTERRKHLRTETALPLKIFQKGRDVVTETRNISCSGVYCQLSQPLPLMSKIGITLLLPFHQRDKVNAQKISCRGVVVRSEPTIVQEAETALQNVAIFFTDLSQKDKDKINQYVLQTLNK